MIHTTVTGCKFIYYSCKTRMFKKHFYADLSVANNDREVVDTLGVFELGM